MNLKLFFVTLAAIGSSFNAVAEFQINEIMQGNISSLYADNEFPDSWVELFNNDTKPQRLAGYRLGSSEDFNKAAVIDYKSAIGAQDYVVLFCDKTGPDKQHVDLRLDSGKGTIYLFNPEGEIIDHLQYKKMLAPDVSYGRIHDESNTWEFLSKPTPGELNSADIVTDLLPQPIFSHKGFVHYGEGEFELAISIPADANVPDDTKLYYTLDGSEPTLSSPCAENQEATITIDKTTVVRARLLSGKAASPMPVTESYIFHPRNLNLPVISINTNDTYFNDAKQGIWVGNNYKQDWRRPINFEYFISQDNDAVLNMMGECRVHGAWSRVHAQKSMAVYTQKRFGNKAFEYPFWDAKPGIGSVKSFVLRNGGNCFTTNRIADQMSETLFGRNATNFDYMENTAVVAYVNGQYMGIYDLRERSNEDYVDSNYSDIKDIDMVEIATNEVELKAGNIQSYEEYRKLIDSNPTYDQLNEVVDLDNFAQVVVAQSFAINTDWPGNNMVMWRPQSEGGRWRMIVKDLDFYASSSHNTSYLSYLLRTGNHANDNNVGNSPTAVKPFQIMLGLPEFKEKIIDYFSVYLGDFLRKEVVRGHIEQMRDEISDEYDSHLLVYDNPTSYSDWFAAVEKLITWSENRTNACYSIIRNHFELGKKIPVSIITNDNQVTMQDIPLTQPEYIGNYFSGRTLRTDANACYWKATLTYTNNTTVEEFYTDDCYELPLTNNIKSVELEAIGTSTAIKENKERDISVSAVAGNVIVESVSPLTGITVTDIAGRTVMSVPGGMMQAEITLPYSGIYIVKAHNRSGQTVTVKVKG